MLYEIILTMNPWKLSILVFLFWSMCAMVSQLVPFAQVNERKRKDLQNRLLSFFSGVLVAALGGMYVYSNPDLRAPNSNYIEMTCTFGMGYFVYDFVFLTFLKILDLQTAIHHVCCSLALAISLQHGIAGGVPVAAIFYGEVTNPSMQLRVFLKAYGLKNTKLYEISECFFIFLYIYARCICGIPIMYEGLSISESHLLVKIFIVIVLL